MSEQGFEYLDARATKSRGEHREDESAQPGLRASMDAAMSGRLDVAGPHAVTHLQRAAGNAAVGALMGEETTSPVLDVVGKGGGSPLDPGVRADMESSLGQDFSDVRVHTDSKAADSAAAVSAHAYTVGNEVVFQQGVYDPASDSGRRTLAHELTHVVQQRSGPVDGTSTGDGVAVSDPSDRFEREASSVADSIGSPGSVAPVAGTGGGAAVQRETEDEDEEVQALAIQREAEDEDEEVQALAIQRETEDEDEEVQA